MIRTSYSTYQQFSFTTAANTSEAVVLLYAISLVECINIITLWFLQRAII